MFDMNLKDVSSLNKNHNHQSFSKARYEDNGSFTLEEKSDEIHYDMISYCTMHPDREESLIFTIKAYWKNNRDFYTKNNEYPHPIDKDENEYNLKSYSELEIENLKYASIGNFLKNILYSKFSHIRF